MINKLIELVYPHTNDSEKFVLKNKGTWYSTKYRYVLYSGNGGKTFKKVHKAIEPLFTHGNTIFKYNWTFEPLTFNAEDESFTKYKDRFKSLEDIKNYENEQYERYRKGLKEIVERRKKYNEKFEKNIQ